MRNCLLRLAPVLAAAAIAITMAAGNASAATTSHMAQRSAQAMAASSQTVQARGGTTPAHWHPHHMWGNHMWGHHMWGWAQPPVHHCPALFFCEWPAPNWPGNPPFKVAACGITYPAPFSGATQVGSWVNNQVPPRSGPRVHINFKTGSFTTNPPVSKSQYFLWRGQQSVRVC